ARLTMNRVLVLVGSSPACRLRLRDDRVSRYHCGLLRTPPGVWLIDLLHGTGARLNGRSLRWALVKEGDRLQGGPYLRRVWYPDVRWDAPPRSVVEIPADDTSGAGELPQEQGGLEPAATEASVLVATLRAELDQAREHQRDAEALRQQLADSRTECDGLRERGGALEAQAAGVAGLQARLEAAEAGARELDAA